MAVLKKIMDKFRAQSFLGRPATFGDDRHLTNRLLELGYMSIYQPHALAYTDTPKNILGYWKQQLRWSKSFVRESLWQLKSFRKQSFNMSVDYLLTIFLSFFLFFSYINTIFSSIKAVSAANLNFNNSLYLIDAKWISFIITCIVMALIKGIYLKYFVMKFNLLRLIGQRKILRYAIFYSMLYIGLLVLSKPVAFLTPLNTSWGTRG
jgi:cellulose synthase/poly-beta-1,6-N-acetylglucosamine synthase-like glycosyltransferase